MKKLFLSLIAVFCSIQAHAFQLPNGKDGKVALIVQDIGVNVFLTTSAIPSLINGATNSVFAQSQKGSTVAIYGILTSTPPNLGAILAPGFVELRATNTANTSSELLIPPVKIGNFMSTATVIPFNNTPVSQNVFIEFNPPIIAMDNLSVNIASAVGDCTMCNFEAAIFYRYLATNTMTSENFWIPTDDYQGMSPIGSSLYGVRVGTQGVAAGGAANDRLGTEVFDQTNGNLFIYTSTIPTNQDQLLLYGWSSSSGTLTNSFRLNAATGTYTSVTDKIPNFLPNIYYRTLGKVQADVQDFGHFNFPWPVIVPTKVTAAGAGNGIWVIPGSVNDKLRFYVRSRRNLRY